MRELDEVAAGFANDNEITHTSAVVSRTFNERSVISRSRCNGGHLFSPFTLKAKMVKRLPNFAVANYDDEFWVLTFRRRWAEPDGATALKPPITNYRETTDIREEANRAFKIADW